MIHGCAYFAVATIFNNSTDFVPRIRFSVPFFPFICVRAQKNMPFSANANHINTLDCPNWTANGTHGTRVNSVFGTVYDVQFFAKMGHFWDTRSFSARHIWDVTVRRVKKYSQMI